MMIASLLLACCTVLAPQEPLRLGLLAVDQPGSPDLPFVRGARLAAEACNKKGGVDGAKVELVLEASPMGPDVAAAVARLQAAGVTAIVAPPNQDLAFAARRAAADKLPCLGFAPEPAAVAKVFDALLGRTFCMQRVGLVRDQTKAAREFGKFLAKTGLSAPASLAWELDIAVSPKALAKQFEKDRPEILLVDAEPDAVVQFLTQALANDTMPVVLTPRAYGEAVRQLGRTMFAVLGQSPATSSVTSQFRSDYERDFGVPGFGAAEGYEGVSALLHAIDVADSRDLAAVQTALGTTTVEGLRGRVAFDKTLGAMAPPLAAWLLQEARPSPYVPGVVPLTAPGTSRGTVASPAAGPQAQVGVPFGTFRTRQFAFEEGAQWVLCLWSDEEGFTSREDLLQLGLSTGGADPMLDHLVREEIMARVLAIVSTKFGRREDGTGIAGKSLRICFGAHLAVKEREKKKQRLWPARFGGDHPEAGGEAFGTFCRVYTTFIRRTIFQAHALAPALSAADRPFLDGTYVFGSNLDLDKRSELIRALINGYGGSMALTLAHEVGHLAGLDHVTDDPVEIMNVNEGGGIDYRDAHFGPATWEIMQKRYGLVGDKGGKAH